MIGVSKVAARTPGTKKMSTTKQGGLIFNFNLCHIYHHFQNKFYIQIKALQPELLFAYRIYSESDDITKLLLNCSNRKILNPLFFETPCISKYLTLKDFSIGVVSQLKLKVGFVHLCPGQAGSKPFILGPLKNIEINYPMFCIS